MTGSGHGFSLQGLPVAEVPSEPRYQDFEKKLPYAPAVLNFHRTYNYVLLLSKQPPVWPLHSRGQEAKCGRGEGHRCVPTRSYHLCARTCTLSA